MTSHDRRSEPHSMTEEVYRHRITDVIEHTATAVDDLFPDLP